jgi:DNA modification methylase
MAITQHDITDSKEDKFAIWNELELLKVVPNEAILLANADLQKAIPAIAKDERIIGLIESIIHELPTRHHLYLGDSRSMANIPDESVHLVLTSPPYWTLKKYVDGEGQLGHIDDYEAFLSELDKVWEHALRVLVPGGRLIIVVGDVCLSRRQFGRHMVMPLHASIQEHCRHMGFDNLTPIIWHKIANAKYEVDGGGGFLGKPYEPNGVIKNDIEYILFQRKPGGYRQPNMPTKLLSVISEKNHKEWFQQIWTLGGASLKQHPAPFPIELAERLIRMFSFVGDTVLDPFSGSGTTSIAASSWGRHSIGIEVIPSYYNLAVDRISKNRASLFSQMEIETYQL